MFLLYRLVFLTLFLGVFLPFGATFLKLALEVICITGQTILTGNKVSSNFQCQNDLR
jgi:hypothetical protein